MWPWRYQLVLLSVLAAQNTILVLLIKSSLAASTHPTTLNVIAVELVKIAICLLLELPRHHYHPHTLLHSASADPQKHRYTLPAILYALQNNLCLLAMSRMSAVEYQVLYQCKILVTAVMAWWWLKRPITGWQWVSLVLLVAGVSVVAVPSASVSDARYSGGGWGVRRWGWERWQRLPCLPGIAVYIWSGWQRMCPKRGAQSPCNQSDSPFTRYPSPSYCTFLTATNQTPSFHCHDC